MKRTKKLAFTIVELLVVIAIIGIIAAVTIPAIQNIYNNKTTEIVEIYNGSTVYCYCGEELIFEGKKDNMPDFSNEYTLLDINYKDGCVYMYFAKK